MAYRSVHFFCVLSSHDHRNKFIVMTISIEYLFKKKLIFFFIRKFKRIYIPFFDSMTPVDSFVFNLKEKFPLKYYLPINFHCKILVLGWFSIGVVGIFLIANESSNKRETYCRNCTNLASKKSHKTTTVFNTNKTIKKVHQNSRTCSARAVQCIK